jgi:hypothetical protein
MIAPLVEHKAALASRAEQVHTSVAQLIGIHPIEVCGILKICLHGCKITHYFIYKRTIWVKSENCEAICETKVSGNRRTFAP